MILTTGYVKCFSLFLLLHSLVTLISLLKCAIRKYCLILNILLLLKGRYFSDEQIYFDY